MGNLTRNFRNVNHLLTLLVIIFVILHVRKGENEWLEERILTKVKFCLLLGM